jgi:putative ABC transport system permease protein
MLLEARKAALPLGAIVGYVLTDIITLRAFGWSLHYLWSWSDTLVLVLVTLSSVIIATALPLWRLVSRPLISSLQSELL